METNNYPWRADELARAAMLMYFLADASGSMAGAKNASLNTAVRESLVEVAEISRNNPDAIIKLAAAVFASDAKWMYDKPLEAENFKWQDVAASGMTRLGAAFKLLNEKLSRSHGWMNEPKGLLAPTFILLCDGQPTDDWENELAKLKENKWYDVATRIAIAIGNDADKEMLAKFTGSMETVITVHDVNQLSKMIKAVIVSSAKVNSKTSDVNKPGNGSTAAAPQNPAKDIISIVKKDVDADPTLAGVEIGNTTAGGDDDWGDFDS